MTSRVIDTNVYCDALRNDAWALNLLEFSDHIWVPMVVLGELLAGFRYGDREQRNQSLLNRFLAKKTVGVIDVTQRVAEYYGLIFAALKKQGRLIPTNDIWIAASAFAAKAPLVTQDRHFASIEGLELITPE